MKALGFDPGYGITGWGCVSDEPDLKAVSYGSIETLIGEELPVRLADLYEQTHSILEQCKPDAVAVEKLYFGRNITTAEGVYEARGVILACAGKHRIKLVELTPNQIKKAITGSGKATKQDVIRMVQKIMNLKLKGPDDIADGIACAVAGITLHRQNMALSNRGIVK